MLLKHLIKGQQLFQLFLVVLKAKNPIADVRMNDSNRIFLFMDSMKYLPVPSGNGSENVAQVTIPILAAISDIRKYIEYKCCVGGSYGCKCDKSNHHKVGYTSRSLFSCPSSHLFFFQGFHGPSSHLQSLQGRQGDGIQ